MFRPLKGHHQAKNTCYKHKKDMQSLFHRIIIIS